MKVLRAGLIQQSKIMEEINLYHIGIPISGAMDQRNYLLANKLGKQLDYSCYRVCLSRPSIKIKKWYKLIFVSLEM